jgi:hypothetical protein
VTIYVLRIPGEPPRALRWTIHDPRSNHGQGALLSGLVLLDGATFRALRDLLGAWLETDNPARARRALGLPDDEFLGAHS